MLAIVDDPRHFRAEVFTVHDPVDEAVLQQELAGLEALRQLQTERVPDRSATGETDERARLGER